MAIQKINQDGSIKLNSATMKAMSLEAGDSVSVTAAGDSIMLRRFIKPQVYANIAPKLCELLSKRFNIPVIVTDKTEALAIYGDCDVPVSTELDDSVLFQIKFKDEYVKTTPTGNIKVFTDEDYICGAVIPVAYEDVIYGGIIILADKCSVFNDEVMLGCLRFTAEYIANECHINE